jgi:hypothetical protein
MPMPSPPPPSSVRRYPNIEGPDRVSPGQQFSLQVSLTMEPLSKGVQVQPGPGSEADQEGRLTMTLPKRDDGKPWQIDVVLTAPDFDIERGRNRATIVLPADGDSTPALFALTPKPRDSALFPARVSVTFWADGAYLARATRNINVGADQPGPASRVEPTDNKGRGLMAGPATISTATTAPDLTVYVQESRVGDRTACQLTIESPFLQPASAPCTPAGELRPWLSEQYNAILRASRSFRGVKTAASDAPATREQALALLRGVGRELYRRAAGSLFDSAFWRLVDLEQKGGFQFRTIQIYTNNPSLPWELMVPSNGKRTRDGFLATEFEVVRWHITEEVSTHDKPRRHLALRRVSAIVPAYSGALALPHQNDEIAVLQQLNGFQRVEARISPIRQLLSDPPEGIVHFAGHGVAAPTAGGTVDYAIQLEGDTTLDLMSWRGLANDDARHHPLYFLNACDVGQVNRVLNFVDGWAPTVLDSGGSGFIGGLWPLSDQGAAAFATRFYQGMEDAMAHGGSASVATLLKNSRQGFFRTGDPTFLAYVFYGDVNLSIFRP